MRLDFLSLHEIQHARGKYRIIDRAALSRLLGAPEARLGEVHTERIETAVAGAQRSREPQWSEAIAVGRRAFVEADSPHKAPS